MGVLPPLNTQQWQQVFQEYQNYPEYQKINRGMSLTEFKRIFWWEYIHRVLGRLIGIVFFVPLLFFALTGHIRKVKIPIFLGLFVLGGLQGLLGWYMVKSGLVNDPHVSQYRLTAHLSLAVFIYALLLWMMFTHHRISPNRLSTVSIKGSQFVKWLILFVGLMIVSGGFMAGTKAGHIYNTFPKMGHTWLPDQILALQPWWRNFFENTVAIQLQHRVQAFLTFALIICFYVYMCRTTSRSLKTALNLVLILAMVQVGLGILTLVLKVPVIIAALHQGGAILLLSALIYTAYLVKYKTE